MIESAKGDMAPGTSVLVLLSSAAAIDTVAETLQGLGMELTRSDLSVQQQDHVRAAFGDPAGGQRDGPLRPRSRYITSFTCPGARNTHDLGIAGGGRQRLRAQVPPRQPAATCGWGRSERTAITPSRSRSRRRVEPDGDLGEDSGEDCPDRARQIRGWHRVALA